MIMKKIILLPIFFLSLISCNKGTNGFPNPFPNDEYLTKRIGFNIGENEKFSRVLTSDEINTIENTIASSDFYDSFINKETIQKHNRDYTRAFAGEFKHGYDASNVLNDEETTVIKYNKNPVDPDKSSRRRRITESSSNSVRDYSYGQIQKNTITTKYLHEEGTSDDKSEELGKIYERIKVVQQNKYTTVSQDKKPVVIYDEGKSQEEIDPAHGDKYYYISQKDYIFKPDIHSGADRNDDVILVSEESKPYEPHPGSGESGRIKFGDDREYAAMENSINVAKLQLIKKSALYDDWYLVKYFRKYTEIAITSEVIQPNVPISLLTNPIVINFTEEIHSFFIDPVGYSLDNLPTITEVER